MDNGDDPERTVPLKSIGHHGGVDRFVVGHAHLMHLGAVLAQPVAEPGGVNAGDEVQAAGSGLDERAGRSLDPENRLALHQDDVIRRAGELREQPLGLLEPLEEDGVVVKHDRLRQRREDARRGHRGSGGEREIGLPHLVLLISSSSAPVRVFSHM